MTQTPSCWFSVPQIWRPNNQVKQKWPCTVSHTILLTFYSSINWNCSESIFLLLYRVLRHFRDLFSINIFLFLIVSFFQGHHKHNFNSINMVWSILIMTTEDFSIYLSFQDSFQNCLLIYRLKPETILIWDKMASLQESVRESKLAYFQLLLFWGCPNVFIITVELLGFVIGCELEVE